MSNELPIDNVCGCVYRASWKQFKSGCAEKEGCRGRVTSRHNTDRGIRVEALYNGIDEFRHVARMFTLIFRIEAGRTRAKISELARRSYTVHRLEIQT